MKLKIIIAVAIAMAANTFSFAIRPMSYPAHQEVNSIVSVHTDSNHSQRILSNQQVVGSVVDILRSRNSGDLLSSAVYIGGKGEIYSEYVNTYNLYKSNNSNSSDEFKMPYADLVVTSTVGEWVTSLSHIQVNNASSSSIILPNAYFIIGNFSKSPFYMFGGKKVIDFGRLSSKNNFSPSLTRAYFMPYGGQVGVGFSLNNLDFAVTLVNGRGEAMMNSQASNVQNINNFAFNISYYGKIKDVEYYVGTGYLNATGFSANQSDVLKIDGKPVYYENQDKMVRAIDFNLGLHTQGISIEGEFLATIPGVKGMNQTSVYANAFKGQGGIYDGAASYPDTAGLTAFGFSSLPNLIAFDAGSSVKSWSLGSSCVTPIVGKDTVFYLSYSQVIQNVNNNLYQFEIGTRYNLVDTIWIGGSYNYMSGKSSSKNIGELNTLMLDTTIYF